MEDLLNSGNTVHDMVLDLIYFLYINFKIPVRVSASSKA